MWQAILVFVVMSVTDTFDALKTRLIVSGRWMLGGTFDFAKELGDFAWLGLGIDSFVKKGITLQLLWIVIAMYCGSIVGTFLGIHADREIANRFPDD